MPPGRPRKQRLSDSTASGAITRPEAVTMQTPSPVRTPEQSAQKQKLPIVTAVQKQALIENLQLEVTERARKLRAEYALHAQGLRSRLEMRVNRIPQALRSTNLLELIDRFADENLARPNPAAKRVLQDSSRHVERPRPAPEPRSSPARNRGVKRASNEMSTVSAEDKENVDAELNMPKKRTKTTTDDLTKPRPTRSASRKVPASQVLSPRSHNSTSVVRSPPKVTSSPSKSNLSRPLSPMKSASSVTGLLDKIRPPPRTTSRQAQTGPSATAATTGRGRKAMGAAGASAKEERRRVASSGSNTSDASSGTTIVRNLTSATTAPTKRTVLTKKGPTGTTTRKTTAAKKEPHVAATASANGRTLRARR